MENIGGRLPVSTSALGERVAFAELQCGERRKSAHFLQVT